MAICDDKEFWSEGESEQDLAIYNYQCPCLDTYAENAADSWVCTLGLFKQHGQYSHYGMSFKDMVHQDLRPDDCLDAYALRERMHDPNTELVCEVVIR